jgi:hypothetical protein
MVVCVDPIQITQFKETMHELSENINNLARIEMRVDDSVSCKTRIHSKFINIPVYMPDDNEVSGAKDYNIELHVCGIIIKHKKDD